MLATSRRCLAGQRRPRRLIGHPPAVPFSIGAAIHVVGRSPDGITVVENRRQAQQVLNEMRMSGRKLFACDTEVKDIDVARQSPVYNGEVTCVSIYGGEELDWGNGPNIWIDALDGEEGTLAEFGRFFGAESVKKVWHNYSFDRHVMFNKPFRIDVRGFGGDTMHMARLLDTSRMIDGGYSLEALSNAFLGHTRGKTSMKELFGRNKLRKDGSEGKIRELPPIEAIQREQRLKWMKYSCLDAQSTYELYMYLKNELSKEEWKLDSNSSKGTLFDFYNTYLVSFGELLTDIEREGIQVADEQAVLSVYTQAHHDIVYELGKFRDWLDKSGAMYRAQDCDRVNLKSTVQMQYVLFAKNNILRPQRRAEKAGVQPKVATVRVENTERFVEDGKDKPLKYRDLEFKGLGLESSKFTAKGWPAVSADALRTLAGNPKQGQYGELINQVKTRGGAGWDHTFNSDNEARYACEAIDSLCTANSIETMISHFIDPLKVMPDAERRLHTSINLNTDTGRLSSRRPNLQNQPALEKDRYKIRDLFCAREGNALIVADYGQLELRVLAHLTNCQSMIEAFELGGDFHSRTAMGMYTHIAEAAERGEVLLEWHYPDGEAPPVPLIKDVFASERRKAKVLNFSIAYGKTEYGLAKDWGVDTAEAKETVDKWYGDRSEVLKWQTDMKAFASKHGYVPTIWGRRRKLTAINSRNRGMRGHHERAAINTPIQGSAADVVMAAMIKIHWNDVLRTLGWTTVLQVHDEVILEGPEHSKEEALAKVVELMERPFDDVPLPHLGHLDTPERRDELRIKLKVDMVVDAKCESTWYKAK